MRKIIFLFLIVSAVPLFGLLTLTSDFVSSVIPGWHTTVHPNLFLTVMAILNVAVSGLGVYLVYKVRNKAELVALGVHLLASNAILAVTKVPFRFLSGPQSGTDVVLQMLQVFKTAMIVFVLEQLVFYIYLWRCFRSSRDTQHP